MPSPKQPMFGTIRGQHPSGRPPRHLSPSDPAFRSGVFLPERPRSELAVPPSLRRPPAAAPKPKPKPRPRRRAPATPRNPLHRVERILIDEANRGFTT